MNRVKTHRPRGQSHDRLGGLCRQAFVVPFSRKGRGVCPSGFATTASLRRITSSGGPSRRMTKGNVGKQCDTATGGHGVGGHATVEHAMGGCCDATHATPMPRSHATSRIALAKPMARMGEEFPLQCPACGGDIRLVAFVTDPGPIRKTLTLAHSDSWIVAGGRC